VIGEVSDVRGLLMRHVGDNAADGLLAFSVKGDGADPCVDTADAGCSDVAVEDEGAHAAPRGTATAGGGVEGGLVDVANPAGPNVAGDHLQLVGGVALALGAAEDVQAGACGGLEVSDVIEGTSEATEVHEADADNIVGCVGCAGPGAGGHPGRGAAALWPPGQPARAPALAAAGGSRRPRGRSCAVGCSARAAGRGRGRWSWSVAVGWLGRGATQSPRGSGTTLGRGAR